MMPAADAVLLPICVVLSVLGVLVTVVGWRRGRPADVVRGPALVLAPIGLYLTGLLRVVWDFVVGIVGWAGRLAFSPVVWIGMGLLGLAVVLLAAGGFVSSRRQPKAVAKPGTKAVSPGGSAGGPTGASTGRKPAGKAAGKADVDPEMAEIEALLKSRGID